MLCLIASRLLVCPQGVWLSSWVFGFFSVSNTGMCECRYIIGHVKAENLDH